MLGVRHCEGDRGVVLLLREILGEGVTMGDVDKRNTRERVRGVRRGGKRGCTGGGVGCWGLQGGNLGAAKHCSRPQGIGGVNCWSPGEGQGPGGIEHSRPKRRTL